MPDAPCVAGGARLTPLGMPEQREETTPPAVFSFTDAGKTALPLTLLTFMGTLRLLNGLRIGDLQRAGIWTDLPQRERGHHYQAFRSNPSGYLLNADADTRARLWALIVGDAA